MWPFSFLPNISSNLQKRLWRFVLKRTISKFLIVDELALPDLDVQIANGTLTINNAKINLDSLNRYLSSWGLLVKEGIIKRFTLQTNILDGEGEVEIEDVTIKFASVQEEGLVFYDAIEEDPLELQTFAKTLLIDMNLEDEFSSRQSKLDNVNGIDILRYAINILFNKFSLSIKNLNIQFQGSQKNDALSIIIPKLMIENGQLENESLEVSFEEGFRVSTAVGFKLESNLYSYINLKFLGIIPILSVNLRYLSIDLQPLALNALKELISLYQFPGMNSNTSKSELLVNWEVNLLECHLEMNFGVLSFKDCKVSSSGELVTMCLSDVYSEDLLMAEAVIFEFTDSLNMTVKTIKINKWNSSYMDKLASYNISNGNRNYGNNSRFSALKIRILIDSCSAKCLDLPTLKTRLAFSLEKVECIWQKSQKSIHAKMFAIFSDVFNVDIKSMSIFKARKAAPPQAEGYNFFEDINYIIEGTDFINPWTKPEDYFLLRSKVLETTVNHYHFAIEEVKVKISQLEALKDLLKQLSLKESSTVTNQSITCSVLRLALSESSCALEVLGTDLEVLLHKSRDFHVDFRLNLESISVNSIHLYNRILTTSLDPHYKSFILTASKSDKAINIISSKLAGGFVAIPLYDDENLTKIWSFFKNNNDSSASTPQFSVYLQLDSLSFKTLDSNDCVAPHVLYFKTSRFVAKPCECKYFGFLEDGEFLVSPSSEQTRAVEGLFDDPFIYWREQNYKRVCVIDCLPISLLKIDDQWIVHMTKNELCIEIYEDSMEVLAGIIDYYRKNILNRRTILPSLEDPEPSENVDSKDVNSLNNCADFNTTHFHSNTARPFEFDEEFHKSNISSPLKNSNTEDACASTDLNVEFQNYFEDELMEVDLEDLGLVDDSEDIDEFVCYDSIEAEDLNNQNFPFLISKEPVPLKIQLKDFSLKIKIIEGTLWRLDQKSNSSVPVDGFNYFRSPTLNKSTYSESSYTLTYSSSRRSMRSEGFEDSQYYSPSKDYIEIIINGLNSQFDFKPLFPTLNPSMTLSDLRLCIKDMLIADHVRASKWKTLLGKWRARRNSLAEMIKVDIKSIYVPREGVKYLEDQLEYNINVDLHPLRFHVDQDTLLFLVQFFSILKSKDSVSPSGSEDLNPSNIFIQKFKFGNLKIKLDYKPKKLDFKKFILGRQLEVLNLFDLEDAELSFPSVELLGLDGIDNLCRCLIRTWMPYIKNTQIKNIVSGITPVRTAINLGGGVSNLVILPINQYKKNGKILKGLKRGALSFLYSTALESAKLGKKLAIASNIILENADDLLDPKPENSSSSGKYSLPPADLKEGLNSAYTCMKTNVKEAAQTIIAIPVKVYEQQGSGKAAKAVLRAMPIAIVKTMMAASEAIEKTLTGAEGSLDPSRGKEVKSKYKTTDDYQHPSPNDDHYQFGPSSYS